MKRFGKVTSRSIFVCPTCEIYQKIPSLRNVTFLYFFRARTNLHVADIKSQFHPQGSPHSGSPHGGFQLPMLLFSKVFSTLRCLLRKSLDSLPLRNKNIIAPQQTFLTYLLTTRDDCGYMPRGPNVAISLCIVSNAKQDLSYFC